MKNCRNLLNGSEKVLKCQIVRKLSMENDLSKLTCGELITLYNRNQRKSLNFIERGEKSPYRVENMDIKIILDERGHKYGNKCLKCGVSLVKKK